MRCELPRRSRADGEKMVGPGWKHERKPLRDDERDTYGCHLLCDRCTFSIYTTVYDVSSKQGALRGVLNDSKWQTKSCYTECGVLSNLATSGLYLEPLKMIDM